MKRTLRNGTIIDGRGGPPVAGMDITLKDGLIESITSTADRTSLEVSVESDVLDCTDKFILPGLIDAHVHLAFVPYDHDSAIVQQVVDDSEQMLTLREARHAQECLQAGITTVRDCGGRGMTTLAVRDAITARLMPGPRILASGMPITTTFGHLFFCGLEVEGTDNVRVATRRLAKEGADLIKVMVTGGIMTRNAKPAIPQYSQVELDALCEEARRLDKRVAAHVGSAEGVRRCVQAGVNTIEHCGWANPDGSSGYDPRVVERMAEQGVFVGATVAGIVRNRLLLETWPSETERQRGLEETYHNWQSFRKMRAAGVPFVLCSDAGVRSTPFRDFALSLRCYQMMMDVSALETIRATTETAARALGLEAEIGTIEPGKIADLLVLDADPLADLANIGRVAWVVRAGRVVVQGENLVLN